MVDLAIWLVSCAVVVSFAVLVGIVVALVIYETDASTKSHIKSAPGKPPARSVKHTTK